MKIASWNVNSLRIRLPQVLDWLRSEQPQVLVLQETKTMDDNFPRQEIESCGYQVVYSGQKAYNGVAVISQQPMLDIVTDVPRLDDPQRRVLGVTIDDVRLLNLYVVNGAEIGSEKYQYKMRWLKAVTEYIKTDREAHKNYLILGDFNIAPEDQDVHDVELWRDKILCSAAERQALQGILDLGFRDSFRLFPQKENIYSWWDYRAAAFRRNRGLRIDLILSSENMSNLCISSIINKAARKWPQPSDHAPVVAEFDC